MLLFEYIERREVKKKKELKEKKELERRERDKERDKEEENSLRHSFHIYVPKKRSPLEEIERLQVNLDDQIGGKESLRKSRRVSAKKEKRVPKAAVLDPLQPLRFHFLSLSSFSLSPPPPQHSWKLVSVAQDGSSAHDDSSREGESEREREEKEKEERLEEGDEDEEMAEDELEGNSHTLPLYFSISLPPSLSLSLFLSFSLSLFLFLSFSIDFSLSYFSIFFFSIVIFKNLPF